MILAFTGAGISKASGIPTFDEQGDLREKLSRNFAIQNITEFQETIYNMFNTCSRALPNDAHIALAQYDIPILTMNVDSLHQKAGSKHVVNLHGKLPNIVLYGDPAPNYQTAFDWVSQLRDGDIFLIIGTSFYTVISEQLRILAQQQGAEIVIVNENAENTVRNFLETHKNNIEPYEKFIVRDISF